MAEMIRSVVEEEMPELAPINVKTVATDDNRSYHITSKKIERILGFVPTRTVQDTARELCQLFREGKLPNSLDNDRYFNVNTVKSVELV